MSRKTLSFSQDEEQIGGKKTHRRRVTKRTGDKRFTPQLDNLVFLFFSGGCLSCASKTSGKRKKETWTRGDREGIIFIEVVSCMSAPLRAKEEYRGGQREAKAFSCLA